MNLTFPHPRIARVSKIHLNMCAEIWADSWSGTASIGFGSRKSRISLCFCVCSVRGGQFHIRTHILERCRNMKSCPEQDELLSNIVAVTFQIFANGFI